jgi:hypothetical protein
MGFKLCIEVLDYAPTTLTHREKLALSVLADDANEGTRTTFSSVEDPKILRRAKLNRPQLYAVLKSLITKGVLKKVRSGTQHALARYQILPLAPNQCQEKPDTGQCQEKPDPDGPPVSGKTESQCQEKPDASVRKNQTQTLSSHSTSSSSSADSGTPDVSDATDAKKTTKQETNLDRIIDATGADPEEAQTLIDQIRPEVKYSLSGLVDSLIENEDMHERLRKLRADRAPRPRPARTPTRCTRHFMPLACGACASDIETGDFADAVKLLREHGPDVRWDLAQNQALTQHLGETA